MHLQVIKLREELESKTHEFQRRIEELESENNDSSYLSGQKDKKIKEMESQLVVMRQKLAEATSQT